MNEVKKFQVWMEGYACTGQSSGASFQGTFEAPTFVEACDIAFKDEKHKQYYDRDRLTYWGCKLFDNGNDAVKNFG
jgi:hypothetical protein